MPQKLRTTSRALILIGILALTGHPSLLDARPAGVPSAEPVYSPPRTDRAFPQRAGIVSPRAAALLGRAPHEECVLWIYFHDKGIADESAAVARLEPRSERRRLRGLMPDARDLPVSSEYLGRLARPDLSVRHTSRWLNAVSVAVPASAIPEIAALPFVRKVDIVHRFRRSDPGRLIEEGYLDPGVEPIEHGVTRPGAAVQLDWKGPGGGVSPATAYPAEEALHYGPSFSQNAQIGIMNLHRQGYTGAGVRICILDTGFRTNHIAFKGRRLIAERDFVFGDGDVDNEPVDHPAAWNHGTSTWSNVGALKPGAIIGGAFESEILLAKTEDIRSETPVEEDHYIAALEWADSLGADVATASLIYLTFDGGIGDHTYADLDGDTIPLSQAVDIAVARGMAVLNAIGNSGPSSGTLGSPADADSVIAVGAVDSLGNVAGFSSRGPTSDGRIKPEVVARGVFNMVASANGFFTHSSGTSFSTPMTAGAVGLLLEAHPGWSGFDVRQALITSASHPGAPDNITGYGLVNAAAAAEQAAKSPPLVSLPFALISPARGTTVPTAAPQFRWERSLAGAAGDTILYSVLLGTDSTFAVVDTFSAGQDTTWFPVAYLTPGQTYHWTVIAENQAGWKRAAYMPSRLQVSATASAFEPDAGTAGPRLSATGPNPFRGVTRFRFRVPAAPEGGFRGWSVDVFDMGGRHVRTLAAGGRGASGLEEELSWDGRDDLGRPLAAGVYFVSLEDGAERSTVKVTITR